MVTRIRESVTAYRAAAGAVQGGRTSPDDGNAGKYGAAVKGMWMIRATLLRYFPGEIPLAYPNPKKWVTSISPGTSSP